MNPSSWALLLGFIALAGATVMDLHSRQVPNRWWSWFTIPMAALLIVELVMAPAAAGIRVASFLAAGGVLFLLWLGRLYGGADAKGLMLLALCFTPVGYYDPMAGRIHPVLDALPPALLAGEAWRRVTNQRNVAFYPFLLGGFLAAYTVGGILWLPLVWLISFIG